MSVDLCRVGYVLCQKVLDSSSGNPMVTKASMTVLCSDKTGTLTTADMRVLPHRTWTHRMTKDDALLYACLASNPANKDVLGAQSMLANRLYSLYSDHQQANKNQIISKMAKSKNEREIHDTGI